MPAISDYNSLVQAIQDVAEDNGTEFIDYIVTAVDLAEERLFRDLELPDIDTIVTGTLTQNSPFLNKPSGYRFAHYLKITDAAGKSVLLIRKRDDYLMEYWPNTTLSGVPKYYSDTTSTTFTIAPTPDINYAYSIKYYKQPSKLAVTNPINYFTQRCVNILYPAAMVEMSKFMKAWSQVNVWESAYQDAKLSWNQMMDRTRRDDLEVPQNPDGGPNTIKSTNESKS